MKVSYKGASQKTGYRRLALLSFDANDLCKIVKAKTVTDLLECRGWNVIHRVRGEVGFAVHDREEYEVFLLDYRQIEALDSSENNPI